MDTIILAYLAGVLDSDGTIGVKRNTYSVRVLKDSSQPTYSERIHIRQVQREAIDLFAATFGGSVGIEDPTAKWGKPLYRWGLTDRKAATALLALLPYLRIKRAQAENCLALRAAKERSKKERVALGRGIMGALARPADISAEMEACFLRAKALNRVGVQPHAV